MMMKVNTTFQMIFFIGKNNFILLHVKIDMKKHKEIQRKILSTKVMTK